MAEVKHNDNERIEFPEQKIIDVEMKKEVERSFIEYSMSVIAARALPDVRDGMKPGQRRILYAMYEDHLTSDKPFRKSATTVGNVLGRYHPHGDAAVYGTMVRMAQDFSYRYTLVEGHGNFGSVDGDGAAAYRYTEARLSKISDELMRDLDKNVVVMTKNFDNRLDEPTVLPARFPNLLVNGSVGIAVGMASSICSFNLKEICDTTIELIKNSDHNIMDTLKAPDFPGGGMIIYDRVTMENVLSSGRGGILVRSKYTYDKENNCIDIYEIPPTTTAEAIIDKIIEKAKGSQLKEISDIRDESDKSGLKITIDLKRGSDPDKLMKKLYKATPLEESFPCNFNVLIGGTPRVLGVKDLLLEWIAFRTEAVRRRVYFDLAKAQKKLHLLQGLEKILLDIDKAIKIVRETAEESEVVPNLMIGFGIDEVQAEYVAEIKLRHLNREYIMKRLQDVEDLKAEIAEMEDTLASKNKIKKILINELKEVSEKYGKERRSEIIYASEIEEDDPEEAVVEDYNVTLFFSKAGYFKKITPQSLRMSGEQKLKEGDEIVQTVETTNAAELLFFSSAHQVYKSKAADFADGKASILGEYIPAKLEFDETENAIYMAVVQKYTGFMIFVFDNGRGARVPMSSYATKTNRKKLINAYCNKFTLHTALYCEQECDILLTSTNGRMMLINTTALSEKAAKDNGGIAVMTQKRGQRIFSAEKYVEGTLDKPHRFRPRNLPAAGNVKKDEDIEQN